MSVDRKREREKRVKANPQRKGGWAVNSSFPFFISWEAQENQKTHFFFSSFLSSSSSPPCFWNQGGWSEHLLPWCGLVPQRLPCRAPWTEVFPSSPHVFCSSSWFWLQVSCALGVPFFPGWLAFFLLFSLASASKISHGISATSASVYAVRPRP